MHRPGRLAGARGVVRTLLADDVPDLVLGSRCVGCERPGRALCVACGGALRGPAYLTAPDPVPAGLPTVWAMAGYGGVVRAALIAHKERGRVMLAGPLGCALAGAVAAAAGELGGSGGGPAVLVVPVPSAGRAVRARGYDPMLAIARQAVRRLRRSGQAARLIKPVRLGRRVLDQTELGAADRLANLAGAFTISERWRGKLAGRSVVLVDDLITTGATLQAASDALRLAGAQVRAAAVVAATRRHPSR